MPNARVDRSPLFDNAYTAMLHRFGYTSTQAQALRGDALRTFQHALTQQLIAQAGIDYWDACEPKSRQSCGCSSSCGSTSKRTTARTTQRNEDGQFTLKAS